MSDEELFVAMPELSVPQPATVSHSMAATVSYQVSPLNQFNFNHPEEWPKWARRFERFRKASGLTNKDEEAQVNTLIYTMGDDAEDILCSFRLSEADSKNYDSVVSAFDSHFVKQRNVMYERAKFNQRRQEPGEPVDAFIYHSTLRPGRVLRIRLATRGDNTRSDCRRSPRRKTVRETAVRPGTNIE